MLLSKSCIYGLRASLYLASNGNGEYMPIRKLSDDLGISFHFLTKILQHLTHEKILESYKGPNGGVRFAKDPDKIFLIDIVVALDGDTLFTECALGLPGCGLMKPCPLHEHWGATRDSIRKMLDETSVMNLAKRSNDESLRLGF